MAITAVSLSIGGSISLLGYVTNAVRHLATDWLIFWFVSRSHLDAIYVNFDRLPFPYPPPVVLLLRPFGLIPLWWSLTVWSVLGVAAIAIASRPFARPLPFIVAMTMPAAVECLINGQTALFIGALAMAGLSRPAWWGLGAVLKPHSFVALPFTARWRSLGIAAAVAILVILLTVAVYGIGTWIRWFGFLGDFRAAVIARGVHDFAMGPAWMARAMLGAVVTVTVFRTEQPMLDRYAALATGSILISPYSLGYDMAGLSIAAAAMLFNEEASPARWAAAGWILSGLFPMAATVALAAALIGERIGLLHFRQVHGRSLHARPVKSRDG